MMKAYKWIKLETVLGIHAEQIRAHGGRSGLRNESLLESALARPENRVVYDRSDIFDLAAVYANGIISNHPFIDGNKRTGFLSAYVFLYVNGWHLQVPEVDAYMAVMVLAQKEVGEKAFAAWLRKHSKRIRKAGAASPKKKKPQ